MLSVLSLRGLVVFAAAGMVCCSVSWAGGLEGGLTTTSRHWSGSMVPTMIRPDAKARRAELAQHERDMAAQAEALRALPDMKEAEDGNTSVAAQPFNARVKILEVSRARDPKKLAYKEALMMAAGEIVDGPMKGRKVGLLHWGMIDGRILKPVPSLSRHVDTEMNLELTPWQVATSQQPVLRTHQTFDDTSVADDLDTPLFWVSRGKLDPASMKSR